MRGIDVRPDRCRACGLCIAVCPRQAIEYDELLNADGYHPIRVRDAGLCSGCALCALMCPHVAITKVHRP